MASGVTSRIDYNDPELFSFDTKPAYPIDMTGVTPMNTETWENTKNSWKAVAADIDRSIQLGTEFILDKKVSPQQHVAREQQYQSYLDNNPVINDTGAKWLLSSAASLGSLGKSIGTAYAAGFVPGAIAGGVAGMPFEAAPGAGTLLHGATALELGHAAGMTTLSSFWGLIGIGKTRAAILSRGLDPDTPTSQVAQIISAPSYAAANMYSWMKLPGFRLAENLVEGGMFKNLINLTSRNSFDLATNFVGNTAAEAIPEGAALAESLIAGKTGFEQVPDEIAHSIRLAAESAWESSKMLAPLFIGHQAVHTPGAIMRGFAHDIRRIGAIVNLAGDTGLGLKDSYKALRHAQEMATDRTGQIDKDAFENSLADYLDKNHKDSIDEYVANEGMGKTRLQSYIDRKTVGKSDVRTPSADNPFVSVDSAHSYLQGLKNVTKAEKVDNGVMVELKGGVKYKVEMTPKIELSEAELASAKETAAAEGATIADNASPRGIHYGQQGQTIRILDPKTNAEIPLDSIIKLADGQATHSTLSHELSHMAWTHLFDAKEQQSILDTFGSKERFARAVELFDINKQSHPLIHKLIDWVNSLVETYKGQKTAWGMAKQASENEFGNRAKRSVETKTAEPTPKSTTAKVKVFITQKDRAELRRRGYTDEQIAKMRPQEAADILETAQDAPGSTTDGQLDIAQVRRVENQAPSIEETKKEARILGSHINDLISDKFTSDITAQAKGQKFIDLYDHDGNPLSAEDLAVDIGNLAEQVYVTWKTRGSRHGLAHLEESLFQKIEYKYDLPESFIEATKESIKRLLERNLGSETEQPSLPNSTRFLENKRSPQLDIQLERRTTERDKLAQRDGRSFVVSTGKITEGYTIPLDKARAKQDTSNPNFTPFIESEKAGEKQREWLLSKEQTAQREAEYNRKMQEGITYTNPKTGQVSVDNSAKGHAETLRRKLNQIDLTTEDGRKQAQAIKETISHIEHRTERKQKAINYIVNKYNMQGYEGVAAKIYSEVDTLMQNRDNKKALANRQIAPHWTDDTSPAQVDLYNRTLQWVYDKYRKGGYALKDKSGKPIKNTFTHYLGKDKNPLSDTVVVGQRKQKFLRQFKDEQNSEIRAIEASYVNEGIASGKTIDPTLARDYAVKEVKSRGRDIAEEAEVAARKQTIAANKFLKDQKRAAELNAMEEQTYPLKGKERTESNNPLAWIKGDKIPTIRSSDRITKNVLARMKRAGLKKDAAYAKEITGRIESQMEHSFGKGWQYSTGDYGVINDELKYLMRHQVNRELGIETTRTDFENAQADYYRQQQLKEDAAESGYWTNDAENIILKDDTEESDILSQKGRVFGTPLQDLINEEAKTTAAKMNIDLDIAMNKQVKQQINDGVQQLFRKYLPFVLKKDADYTKISKLVNATFGMREKLRMFANVDRMKAEEGFLRAIEAIEGKRFKFYDPADPTIQHYGNGFAAYFEIKQYPGNIQFLKDNSPTYQQAMELGLKIDSDPKFAALKHVAETLRTENKEFGEWARREGAITTVLDYWFPHFFKQQQLEQKGDPQAKLFRRQSMSQNERVYEHGLFQGLALGEQLEITDPFAAFYKGRQDMIDTVLNPKILKLADEMGYLKKDAEGSLRKLENPNMTWSEKVDIKGKDVTAFYEGQQFKGTVVKARNGNLLVKVGDKTYEFDPQSVVLDENADARIFGNATAEIKRPYYAHPELARRLNNSFTESKLMKLKGVRQITMANNAFKQLLLFGSLFHETSFARATIFGTPGGFFKNFNIVKIRRDGMDAIMNKDPLLAAGVENGLDLFQFTDYDRQMIRESDQALSDTLHKIGKPGEVLDTAVLDKVRKFKQRYDQHLWGYAGPASKASFFLVVAKRLLEKRAREIAEGKVTREDVLRKAAEHTNNSFGGIPFQAEGVDPTNLHVRRLLLISPDWTTAGIRRIYSAFKTGDEGYLARAFWGRMLTRTAGLALAFNLAASGGDKEGFTENVRMAWKNNDLSWLGNLNITSVSKLWSDVPGKTYTNLMGHFGDNVSGKTFNMTRSLSPLARTSYWAATGKNVFGKEQTTGQFVQNNLPLGVQFLAQENNGRKFEKFLGSHGLKVERNYGKKKGPQ